jgi:hypothetical protein
MALWTENILGRLQFVKDEHMLYQYHARVLLVLDCLHYMKVKLRTVVTLAFFMKLVSLMQILCKK